MYWEDQHTLLLYLPDPVLMWRLRPDIRLSVREWIRPYGPEPADPVLYSWTIDTNAQGFRGSPVARTGKTRVLCLGDSRTLGEGLRTGSTYPDALSEALGPDHEAYNLGADGYSAFQGRRLLQTKGLGLDPDVVVACFGINDTDRAWGIADPERAESVDTFRTASQAILYRSMIFYAASRAYLKLRGWLFGKRPVGAGYGQGPPRLTPAAYAQEIARMRDICQRAGITFIHVILPVNPHYRWRRSESGEIRRFAPYNAAAIAAEPESALDLRASEILNNPTTHFIDDMHLSASGAARVAHAVADFIRERKP